MGAAIRMRDSNADHTLKVSAKTGEGLEDLKALLGKILSEEQIYVESFYLSEAGKIQLIREYGQLLEEYRYWNQSQRPQEIHGKLRTQPDLWNWQKVWVYKVITFEDNNKYNDMSVTRSLTPFDTQIAMQLRCSARILQIFETPDLLRKPPLSHICDPVCKPYRASTNSFLTF